MKPKSKAGQRLAAELQVAYRIDLIVAIEDESVEKTLLAAGLLLGAAFPNQSRESIEDALGFTLGHVVAGARSEVLGGLRQYVETLRGEAFALQAIAYDEVLARIDAMLADEPLTLIMEEPPA